MAIACCIPILIYADSNCPECIVDPGGPDQAGVCIKYTLEPPQQACDQAELTSMHECLLPSTTTTITFKRWVDHPTHSPPFCIYDDTTLVDNYTFQNYQCYQEYEEWCGGNTSN